jgi:hypothetical protein
MRPRDLKRAIESLYPTKRAVFIWGPPGVGKSDCVRQASAAHGEFLDIRLPLHEPGDLKFPMVDLAKRTLEFITPLFPQDPQWQGIVCLEELPQCMPATQAAAMQLCLDRRVGDYRLPEGAMVVACGNRQEDRAGANRVLSALSNRFIHLDYDVSLDDWQDWALTAGISPSVRSYLGYKPAQLHRFKPELNERAFPTPRSWHFTSDALAVVPPDLRLETISGCVGREAAAEFIGYLEIEELMTRQYPVEGILKEPERAAVPPLSQGAVLWALSGAVPERCREKHKPTVQAAMRYAMRLPLEFATFMIRSIVKLGGASNALSAPGASDFIARHKHVLLAD